jgi:hypothetical protein
MPSNPFFIQIFINKRASGLPARLPAPLVEPAILL